MTISAREARLRHDAEERRADERRWRAWRHAATGQPQYLLRFGA